MAFGIIEELEPFDFYKILASNPTKLKIENISDVKQNDEGKYFFFITFQLVDSEREIDIGFNIIKVKDDVFKIGKKSKGYPLINHVCNINTSNADFITFTKADIDESLSNYEFIATSEKDKIGKNSFYRIIPVKPDGVVKQ